MPAAQQAADRDRDPLVGIREIHDRVVPELFAVALRLSAVTGPDAALARESSDQIQRALTRLRGILQSTVEQQVARRCSPKALEESARFAVRGSEVVVEADLAGLGPVDPDVGLLLEHFISEAARNALKHAAATRLSFRTETRAGTLSLIALNDGVVGTPEGQRYQPGIGLRLLEVDALQFGGRVTGSRHGDSWSLVLRLPSTVVEGCA